MSGDSPSEGDDANDSPDGDRSETNGFRFGPGLRPLKDLLGNLIDITVTDAPPASTEPTDRSAGDDATRRSPGESDRSPEADRTGAEASRPRTKRRRTSPAAEYLVDTRREDGEFVVTADVPGASADDLSVGIDPRTNELVLGVSGTVVERVGLPWRSVEASDVRLNNGVLEIRLRPDES